VFDLGWSELFIIGLVTLLVVGPKDLPRVLRTISQLVAKARGMAREFQSGVDDMIRESELGDIKKKFNEFKDQADVKSDFMKMLDEQEKAADRSESANTGKTAADAPAEPSIQPPSAQNKPELPESSDEPVAPEPEKQDGRAVS
jgi:sec-independent protein translocase protein TatB